jgi:hypothetical protein
MPLVGSPLVGSKDSRCYVCGPNNPLGLRVSFSPDGAQGSQARYTARPEHAGWNGILHGGVTFALMDEALGWSLYYQDLPAVTARVETRFHKPIAVGAQAACEGMGGETTPPPVRSACGNSRRRGGCYPACASRRNHVPDRPVD